MKKFFFALAFVLSLVGLSFAQDKATLLGNPIIDKNGLLSVGCVIKDAKGTPILVDNFQKNFIVYGGCDQLYSVFSDDSLKGHNGVSLFLSIDVSTISMIHRDRLEKFLHELVSRMKFPQDEILIQAAGTSKVITTFCGNNLDSALKVVDSLKEDSRGFYDGALARNKASDPFLLHLPTTTHANNKTAFMLILNGDEDISSPPNSIFDQVAYKYINIFAVLFKDSADATVYNKYQQATANFYQNIPNSNRGYQGSLFNYDSYSSNISKENDSLFNIFDSLINPDKTSTLNATIPKGDWFKQYKLFISSSLYDVNDTFIIDNPNFNKYSLGILTSTPPESPINFGVHGIASDTCINIIIKNNEDDSIPPRHITSAVITGSSLFSIANVQPAIPAQLKSNDSIILRICFSGGDTTSVLDTLILGVDCFTQSFGLSAQGTAPIIVANDLDFGTVDTGTTLCMNDTIRNLGLGTLILGKNFLNHDVKHFSIADSSRFPLSIAPGGLQTVSVCYTPDLEIDTSRIDWMSNQTNHNEKDFSLLQGRGGLPPMIWNVNSITQYADTLNNPSANYYFILLNNGNRIVKVDTILIIGEDSSQFAIQGFSAPWGFTLHPPDPSHGGMYIQVYVNFFPKLTGAPPARYADRHTIVRATAAGEKTADIYLTATFAKSLVSISPDPKIYPIYPNPATDFITVRSNQKLPVKIYSVLGELLLISETNKKIDTQSLATGTYYLTIGELTSKTLLNIVR